MKPTEKIALIASAGGLAAGLGAAWLLPNAAWWFYVVVGFVFAGGMYSAGVKEAAAERIADGDFAPKEKS